MHVFMNSTENGGNIDDLIRLLGSDRLDNRKKARAALVKIGSPVVPVLVALISHSKADLRWEVINILGEIADPQAAPALAKALEDDAVEVRWRAAEALIRMGRHSLVPLFQRLKERFDSVLMREGAHHVLHCLNDDGILAGPALKVMEALESVEPDVTVPWAVERALEAHVEKGPPVVLDPEAEKNLILRLMEDNPFLDEE